MTAYVSLPPECLRPQDKPVGVHSGLLGIAIDPDYNSNNFLYLAVTLHNTRNSEETAYTNHAVLRVKYYPATMTLAPITEADILVEDTTRPFSGRNHSSGGRMLFLPDGTLLFTVGYNHSPLVSQNMNSFGGKIIRMFPDGRPVCGGDLGAVISNPFCSDNFDGVNPAPRDYIYSLGHKNNQGLVMVRDQVFASEHGEVGGDEINIITRGGNFGFPYFCSGGCVSYDNRKSFGDVYNVPPGTLEQTNINDYIRPVIVWNNRGKAIAPSGIAFYPFDGKYKDSLFVAGLRSRTLFRFSVDANFNLKLRSSIAYGMPFRDIAVADDGAMYVITYFANSSALYRVRRHHCRSLSIRR